MLSERNFTSRMIYILLFLFSLNVFNQSSLILAAVFILVVIFDRGKLYIPANDNVFVVLVFFAAVFFVFSAQNGLNAGISAIGCPMAYYIGLRVQNERIALAQAEKQLKSVTTLLVAGMTCHAVVNFLSWFVSAESILAEHITTSLVWEQKHQQRVLQHI